MPRKRSPSPRAITCNSIFPLTMTIRFRDFDIPQPFAAVWEHQHVFDLVARNPEAGPAQQLFACQQSGDGSHAALQRAHCDAASRPGLSLRASDPATFSASSLETSFLPSDRSAISISSPRSGRWSTLAGAPAWLRCAPTSPILLETEQSARKISFWYGARSKQEIYYEDYFQDLAKVHRNFAFHLANPAPPEQTGHYQNWLTWSVPGIFLSITGVNRFCKRLYSRVHGMTNTNSVSAKNG